MNQALSGIKTITVLSCFAIWLPGQAAGQASALSLSGGAGSTGGTEVISVALTSGNPAPASIQWDLTYNGSELSPISGTYYTTGAAAAAAGKSTSCNSLSANAVRCLVSGLNARALGGGVIATITFQIAAGTNDSASPIETQNVSAADGNGNSASINGSATTVALNLTSPAGWFELVARHSGKCLAVQNASQTPGALTEQWTCSGGTSQLWQATPVANGAFEIVANNSGAGLDVQGSSTANGALVQQWPYWGGANQRWLLQPTSGGYYQIVSVNSGSCLDVSGGPSATQDGILIQQWTCLGGTNQQWEMIPLRWFELVARHSGKCLQVQNSSLALGAPTQQWTCSGAASQVWQALPVANGAFEILSKNSDFALDVQGISTANGAIIQQWAYLGGANQQWLLQSTSGGYYEVVSVNSSSCLDVTGGPSATQDGVVVQQWTCLGGTNQQWQMVPLQ